MLVRKYIGARLASYYAQPSEKVVGSLPKTESIKNSINFKALFGEYHWKRVFKQIYEQQKGQWMTPVELFYPYYSNILANFIATQHRNQTHRIDGNNEQSISENEVHIVELGCGRGTNANCILSYLHEYHPELYSKCTYYLFDSSHTLHSLQNDLLGKSQHGDKVKLILKDLVEVAEGNAPFLNTSNVETYVLALEILDNLPHDKVSRCKQTGGLLQAEIKEKKNLLTSQTESNYEEKFVSLEDPTLKSVLDFEPRYSPHISQNGSKWVPTIACALFDKLFQIRPNARILIADFDWLPQPDLDLSTSQYNQNYKRGEGEPLVTCMDDIDHGCYLSAPNLSDILFPTNFGLLASFLQKKIRHETKNRTKKKEFNETKNVISVMKQADFLWKFGEEEIKKTQSWISRFSPLVHDFGNCSVLTVTRQHARGGK